VVARNAALLERIRALKADHPFWGYRRVWAYLRYVEGLAVNQKRVYGTMKTNALLVQPNPKLRAKRRARTTKRRPTRPTEWWGIDLTKVTIEGFGWVSIPHEHPAERSDRDVEPRRPRLLQIGEEHRRPFRLEPRLSFTDKARQPVLIKQEEPWECIRCGKRFGTRASIERIVEKLGARHWMYSPLS
jgi:HTH-like domain